MKIRHSLWSGVARAPDGPGGGGASPPPPPPPPGGVSPPPPPPGGAAEPFYKPFNLEQPQIDYIEGKGIKDFPGLLKNTMDFERIARERNVIAAPDASDPKKLAEWDGWEKIGWVKDPAKYTEGLKKPALKEGQAFDETSFGDFAKDAHELRVPLPQAQQLFQRQFDKFQQRIADLKAQHESDAAAEKAKLETALKQEWGGDFDAKRDLSQRAMTALGVGEKDAAELEKILGAPRLVKLFETIGSKLGEDTLTGVRGQPGGPMTPAAARAERLRLEADPQWMAIFNDARHSQREDYVKRRNQLLALEAKGAAAA